FRGAKKESRINRVDLVVSKPCLHLRNKKARLDGPCSHVGPSSSRFLLLCFHLSPTSALCRSNLFASSSAHCTHWYRRLRAFYTCPPRLLGCRHFPACRRRDSSFWRAPFCLDASGTTLSN